MAVAGILAGFDALPWAGVTLYSRNSTNVTAPAAGTMHDSGHYPDAVALLNGWQHYRLMNAVMQATWGIAGTPTVTINADDRVVLTVTGAAGTLTLTPGTSDPWGWGGVLTSVTSGGAEVVTATRPWRRGPVVLDDEAVFTVDDGVGVEEQPAHMTQVHSLPAYIGGLGTPDADGVTETLEKWDNTAIDSTNRRIRWGIDAEGRTFTSWPSFGLGSGYTVTWASATFRRALGFTGSESAVLDNGLYVLTSTYPALGVLIARMGLAVLDRSARLVGSSADTLGGDVVGRSWAAYREVDVSMMVRGGLGVVDSQPYRDEENVWLRRVAPYLHRGARCTVCPDWSDARIGRSLVDQFSDASTPAAFSPYVRSDAGGIMGRFRSQVTGDSPDAQALRFGGRVRTMSEPVSLRLRRLADG
jgi:hypothetical protein